MEDYFVAFYENVCIYLEMKSETLNFALYLSVKFYIHLFFITWVFWMRISFHQNYLYLTFKYRMVTASIHI